ncbi:MAG: molybdopterin-dependent oxidoreductase, partial [Proteobacteria bacterium]|nr:molybdopterin-dependent oxidoreductase [Pseudomonadota bacterium]
QTDTTKLDPETGQGVPWETYSFGVQMAEVAVDPARRRVKALRITAVHDLGTVINRLNVEGQIHGGMAMGLGYALSEKYVYAETDSLAKYRLPRAKDMPEFEVHLVEVPRRGGPFGASGAGEFADVPTAPATANAIFNACGIRVRCLPVSRRELAP